MHIYMYFRKELIGTGALNRENTVFRSLGSCRFYYVDSLENVFFSYKKGIHLLLTLSVVELWKWSRFLFLKKR